MWLQIVSVPVVIYNDENETTEITEKRENQNKNKTKNNIEWFIYYFSSFRVRLI